jgi:hypothetical protein
MRKKKGFFVNKKFGKASGLSFPEIIIVIAVLGLLVAQAIPIFIQARNKARSFQSTQTAAAETKPTVGNMSFIRAQSSLWLTSDADVSRMMREVDVFEREHPSIEVTSRQLVMTGQGAIKGVLLNHRPRTPVTNVTVKLEQ